MTVKTKPANEVVKKVFALEADNAIAAHPADHVSEGSAIFSNQKELAALAANWPTQKLIDIWNKIPGVVALKKFASREAAVRRIWAAVGELSHNSPRPAGTKRDKIIALLKRPEGATLKALMTATGWQAHSVRGFISGQLVKRSHFKIKSFRRDGERVYRIRS